MINDPNHPRPQPGRFRFELRALAQLHNFPTLLPAFLAFASHAAEPIYQRQLITFPTNMIITPQREIRSRFIDVDGDGLADLLALNIAEEKLWIYRQRTTGFADVPDDTLTLPPGTAWIGSCDVDPHAGPELLFSTTEGLLYLRQNHGRFETELCSLVQAQQPFSKDTAPMVTWLPGQKERTNVVIPLFSTERVVLYQRDSLREWRAGPALPFYHPRTMWSCNPENWMLGTSPAHRLSISEQFRSGPDNDEEKPENESIRKLLDEQGSKQGWYDYTWQRRVDINHDGREDVVVERVSGALDPKTDIFLFIRGADGTLPERATEVLHCSGFPLAIGPERTVSAVCDLDGDGTCELVLATPKMVYTSSSGLVEILLSRGVDLAINVRALHRGSYSKSPDASIDVTGAIAPDRGSPEMFIIDGDFNGDGRKDLLIRRTVHEWNVYFSSKLGTWFREKPALRLESPLDGYPEVQDLNGDGFSDLVIQKWGDSRVVIFLSRVQPTRMK